MTIRASTDAPEFSRPFAIDDIDAAGTEIEIEAGPAERGRLADRFGLAGIDRLTASLTVTRGASGIPIRVVGRFRAEIRQRCVVSLDSFDSVVENALEVEFVPAADMPAEVDFDVDDVDVLFAAISGAGQGVLRARLGGAFDADADVGLVALVLRMLGLAPEEAAEIAADVAAQGAP